MHLTNRLLDALPRDRRAKLEALTARYDDARAIVMNASDDVFESRARLGEAEKAAALTLERHAETGRISDDERKRVLEPVESAQRVLDRARQRHETATARLEDWRFLENAVAWLEDARNDRIKLKATTQPPVKSGDYHNALARIRSEIDEVDAAWRAAEAAPRPQADALAALHADIDSLAATGEPRVDLRRRVGSPIDIAKTFQMAIHSGSAEAGISPSLVGDGGTSFLVWLLRDEIKAKLGALIEQADDTDALADDEREKRFGELSSRKLDLERQEEAQIVAAEAAGLSIPRRPDADPRAVLEISEA